MIVKYGGAGNAGGDVWRALLANANVGGENVHRGAVLGAAMGARAGLGALPAVLFEGLHHRAEIAQEIDAFVAAVLPPPAQQS